MSRRYMYAQIAENAEADIADPRGAATDTGIQHVTCRQVDSRTRRDLNTGVRCSTAAAKQPPPSRPPTSPSTVPSKLPISAI